MNPSLIQHICKHTAQSVLKACKRPHHLKAVTEHTENYGKNKAHKLPKTSLWGY